MTIFIISFEKKYSLLATCQECGYLYVCEHGHQKYCEICQPSVKRIRTQKRVDKHRENNREHYNELALERWYKYYDNWKILKEYRYEAIKEAYQEHGSLMNQHQIGKGTGRLGMHRNTDFYKEFELIQKEKKRLGM